MAFLNNGRNHKDGVSNEYDVAEYINNNIEDLLNRGWFPEIDEDSTFIICEHKGGTGCIEDAVIHYTDGKGNHKEILISIKNKNKGIGVGSIDYLNSSKVIKMYEDDFYNKIVEVDTDHERIKKTFPESKKRGMLDIIRSEVNNTADHVLTSLSSETLNEILKNQVFCHDDLHMIVNDRKINKLTHTHYSDHPVPKILKDGYLPSIINGRGQTSKKVVFVKDNDVIDFGIRVRLHYNNGITAKLGLSTANKGSQWCFKIQQDKLNKLFEENWPSEGVKTIEV